jgi:hypothetical protein
LQCTIKVMVRGAKISGTDFYGNEGACYRSRPRLIRHSRKDEFRAALNSAIASVKSWPARGPRPR